jgi:rhomboid family GlyGly-CTERM serine protease
MAGLVWALPGVADLLEFDRREILQGAWWRALTAAVTHWDAHHLLWNLAGIAMLGLAFRRPTGAFWAGSGIGAALAIALGLLVEPTPLEHYRGLSGILYGWLVAVVLGYARWSRRLRWSFVGVVVLWTLFESQSSTGMERTLPNGTPIHATAHLYGILGAVIALGLTRRVSGHCAPDLT